MKNIKLLTLLAAILCAASMWAWTGSGTSIDPYQIASESDWNTLKTNVNAGTSYSGMFFQLTADITVSEMVGTDANRFSGTFNGDGHTLTFNKGTSDSYFDEDYCAPFRYINGATFKRLHIAGTIYTSEKYAAGLVGHANGTYDVPNYFRSCQSSVTINSSVAGDGKHGGFIAYNYGVSYIMYCLFDGSFIGSSTTVWGGFVGWTGSNGLSSFLDCLLDPSSITISNDLYRSANFACGSGYSCQVTNCYYSNATSIYPGQGTATNLSVQDASLFGPNEMIMWGKSGGKLVPIMHPIPGNGTAEDPYQIADASDWNTFATSVSGGNTYSGKFFKLMADIEVTTMVGTDADHAFNGTFDGDGHTITATLNSSADYCAPFAYTYGATIKNLHTTGTITTSGKYAGGVVGRNGTGRLTMTNVKSNATISSTFNGEAYHGGLVGYAINATLSGCVFAGQLVGENSSKCGGFVGWKTNTADSSVDLTDCLFAPTQVTMNVSNSKTFVVDNGTVNFTNCYYRQPFGTVQGKQAHSITGATGITVANAGTATVYNVSGITGYDTGIQYNNVLYAAESDAVSLNLSGSTNYKASAGTLSGSTLTMPASDVVIYGAASITTTPTAKTDLVYAGVAQALLNNDGVAEGGTLKYSLDNSNWSADIPTGKNAGNYTVYYMVEGDAGHADFTPENNTIAVSIENAPSDMELTANLDPDPAHDGIYYSTFYHSAADYILPEDVEAYTAFISDDALNLTKVAVAGQSIPAGNAVILKSSIPNYTLTSSAATEVTLENNSLQGVDVETDIENVVSGTCYVLSGNDEDGVGFFLYKAPNRLKAHKAFVDITGSNQAPRRLRFVFNNENAATDIENVQSDDVQSTKVMENGVLYIIKNNARYNAQGQIVNK